MSGLAYKGVTLEEALGNLTSRVRDDLSKAGLADFYFKAEGVSGQGGIASIAHTTSIPEGTSPEMVMKAHEVIGRHVRQFFADRYRL